MHDLEFRGSYNAQIISKGARKAVRLGCSNHLKITSSRKLLGRCVCMLINGAVGKGLYGMVPLSGVMPLRVSDCDRIMVYCRRESDESLASQITRTELPVTDSHEGDHLFVRDTRMHRVLI
ncbi:hypothetical protein CDAR_262861 [Caerostris darwini]|uniref:Uncharacterized protein n=1 Tax=Caerostris darwini TaxID=1538125 RepID=A0AAV4RXZ3_9ARAC|nr:hypothetical protein CDAR_262861 [Caerostris darwini]